MFGHTGSGFLSRTVILVLAIGLAIRLLLAPLLTYPFDIEHWAVVIQNINSGNGLYNLSGYFYTPVWGYILGFESFVINAFGGIPVMGERVTDLFPIEALGFRFYTATTTTIVFNVVMKIPFLIADVVVGYLLWQLVMEKTGDSKKSNLQLMLWFFCPVVVYMCGIQAQFDCFSALMALLAVLLMRKEKFLLAGMMLALAMLLKLWPGALVFVFIPYVLNRYGRDEGLRKLAVLVFGAVVTIAVIFAPSIANGSFVDSLQFILSRSAESSIFEKIFFISFIVVALCICLFSFKDMLRKKENLDDRFLMLCTLVLSGVTLISPGPQYCIVYLPLYAYIVVTSGSVIYRNLFILGGLFCAIGGFANNALSILTSISVYTPWISPADVVGLMQNSELFFTALYSALVISAILQIVICLMLMADQYYFDGTHSPQTRLNLAAEGIRNRIRREQ